MKTVVVASRNPVKVRAVQNAFARMFSDQQFKIESIAVPSCGAGR